MAADEQNFIDITIDDDLKSLLGTSEDRGNVYKGSFNCAPVAMRIKTGQLSKRGTVKFRQDLMHENIVRFHGIWKDIRYIFVFMDLCAGNLEQLINGEYVGPAPGTMEDMMLQVSSGLRYLHSKRILHGNLKPTNILISVPGEGSLPVMKLADFDLHDEIHDEETSFMLSNSTIRNVGWHAPELDDSSGKAPKYTEQSDIFSLGCLYGYAFTYGHHPFGDDDFTRQAKIMTGSPKLERIANVPLKSLILTMISNTDKDRPRLDEIFRHPTFSEIFGIRIDGHLVGRYEWFTGGLDVRSDERADEQELQFKFDSRGRVVQPAYTVLTWQESDLPPKLEMAYSAQVKRIANLLLQVRRMNVEDREKKEFMKQIMRRALTFDVRMPKWLLNLKELDKEQQKAIKGALKTLPQTHQAALSDGDLGAYELQRLLAEPDRMRVLNEIFYWSDPHSSPREWSLLANEPAPNAEESSATNDQISRARRRISKAWIEDRIPPAFYLAAASGHSAFCEKSMGLLNEVKKFKDFTMTSFIYALYILNEESIALACLNCNPKFTLKDFSKGEFLERFPCSLFERDVTKEQAAFVRLSMYGWYGVMKLAGVGFTWIDLFMPAVSLGFYLYDVVTDVILAYYYFTIGEFWASSLTFVFVLLPALVMSQWTARTYVLHSMDFPLASKLHWTFRVFCLICCVSPVACHIDNFTYTWKYFKSIAEVINLTSSQTSTAVDLSETVIEMKCYEKFLLDNKKTTAMVRLIEGFLESAPQMLIQLHYVNVVQMLQTDTWPVTLQYLSLLGSMTSLAWAVASSRPACSMIAAEEPTLLVTLITFFSHFCFIFAGGIVIGAFSPLMWVLFVLMWFHLLFITLAAWRDFPAHGYRRLLYSIISIFTYTPDAPIKTQSYQILVFFIKSIVIMGSLWYAITNDSLGYCCPSVLPVLFWVYVPFSYGILLWLIVTKLETLLNSFAIAAARKVEDFFSSALLSDICQNVVKRMKDLIKYCNPMQECPTNNMESGANNNASPVRRKASPLPGRNKVNTWRELHFVAVLLVASVSPVLYVINMASDGYLVYVYLSKEHYRGFGMTTLTFIIASAAFTSVVNLYMYASHRFLLQSEKLPATSCFYWALRISCLIPCISYLAWYAVLVDKCLTFVTAREQLSDKLTTEERDKWETKKTNFFRIRRDSLAWFLTGDLLVCAPQIILQIYMLATGTSQNDDDQRLIACQHFSIFTSVVSLAWAITASNFSSMCYDESFEKLAKDFIGTFGTGLLTTLGTRLITLTARGLFVSLLARWLVTSQFAELVGWIAALFELLFNFVLTLVWLSWGERAFKYRLFTYPVISLVPTFLLPEPIFRSFYSGLQP